MSNYNGLFSENDPSGGQRLSPAVMAHLGPILQVSVSIPQALAALYTGLQIPLPSPVTGTADTYRCPLALNGYGGEDMSTVKRAT